MKRLTLVLFFLFTANTHAYESGDTYIGVQFGQSTAEIGGIDDIENTYGLVRFGGYVTSNIAIDFRYGDGIDDDTLMGVDFSIDRIFGLYALYHLPLSSSVSIYGLLGYTEADWKAEANGGLLLEEEDDISYGIGLDLGFINIEYVQVLDDSDFEVEVVSIGYTYHFE